MPDRDLTKLSDKDIGAEMTALGCVGCVSSLLLGTGIFFGIRNLCLMSGSPEWLQSISWLVATAGMLIFYRPAVWVVWGWRVRGKGKALLAEQRRRKADAKE